MNFSGKYLFSPLAKQGDLNPGAQVSHILKPEDLKAFYARERSVFASTKALFFGPKSLEKRVQRSLDASKKFTGYVDRVTLITEGSWANKDQAKVALDAIAALSTLRSIVAR